jgi:hypothetical protein
VPPPLDRATSRRHLIAELVDRLVQDNFTASVRRLSPFDCRRRQARARDASHDLDAASLRKPSQNRRDVPRGNMDILAPHAATFRIHSSQVMRCSPELFVGARVADAWMIGVHRAKLRCIPPLRAAFLREET